MKIFLIITSSLLFFSANATYIIPDTKKTERFRHSTGTATGWSLRKNINATYTNDADEDVIDGDERETTTSALNIFYNVPKIFSIEAYGSQSTYEERDPTPREFDSSRMGLNLGVPIYDFVSIGASYSAYEDDSAAESDTENTGYSASVKLFNMIYMGLGVDKYENNNNADSNYDTDFVGLGFVVGNPLRPFFAAELIFRDSDRPTTDVKQRSADVWMNIGSTQPFLSTIATNTVNPSGADSEYRYVEFGIDQSIGSYYVIVTASRNRFEFTNNNSGDINNNSLEIGYRQPRWRVFAKYSKETDDFEGAFQESERVNIAVGGLFRF